MASDYEVIPRGPRGDTEPRDWTVRVTVDDHPGMAVETDLFGMTQAKAEQAAAKLHDKVAADPGTFFGDGA